MSFVPSTVPPSRLRIERSVIVGASGGIGSALARALADEGAAVHGFSRRGLAAHRGLIASVINLEDEASIAAAASALEASEALDLVVVASGLLHSGEVTPEKSYRQLSSASLQRYFAINATGPALVAKHFLPRLRKDRPAIFAVLSARVGSISDNRLGGWYGYRASKAALNMLVKTLSVELARTHPQAACVALHPGTVATPLSQPFQRGVLAEKLFEPQAAARQLLDVIAGLSASDSGNIYAWDGARIQP